MRPTFTRSTVLLWPALISLALGPLVAQARPPVGNGSDSPLLTTTLTRTPTATLCPLPTPEPLWVEPVTSPTNLLTQTITIRIGNGDAVTVTAESGVFTTTGNFDAYGNPALVTMTLFANTTHHLLVLAHVHLVPGPGGCQYGDYTLSTTVDRYGAPLTIVQQAGGGTITPTPTSTSTPTVTPTPTATQPPNAPIYLPLVLHSDVNNNDDCNPTLTPTITPNPLLGHWLRTQSTCPTPTITVTPFPTATPGCVGTATPTAPPPLNAPRFTTPLPTCTPKPTSTPNATVTGTPPTPTQTIVPP